jgi:hypothetical protein
MKKIFLLAAMCSLFASGFSQKAKVDEKSEKIGGGSHNALVVTIYETDADEILKEWKSKMRDHDAKVSTKDGEMFADNALLKTMGNNTVDIYARVEKVKDGEVKFIVGFDLGGAFLNSKEHSSQYNEAKKIVQEFADKVTKESIAGQLKEAEKLLAKRVGEQEDLVKKNKDLQDDIVSYKEKIKKAEDEIVKNNSEQENKKKEIETQKKVVDAIVTKQKAVE